jgi:hypothetical protein
VTALDWCVHLQVEASGKVKALFPNLADVPTVNLDDARDDATTEDDTAANPGPPFVETENENEWEDLVDWETALHGTEV